MQKCQLSRCGSLGLICFQEKISLATDCFRELDPVEPEWFHFFLCYFGMREDRNGQWGDLGTCHFQMYVPRFYITGNHQDAPARVGKICKFIPVKVRRWA